MIRCRLAAIGCAAVFATSCSSGAEQFEGIRPLAAVLDGSSARCAELASSGMSELVDEQGECRTRTGVASLYVFDSPEKRSEWLAVGSRFGIVVVGPNWAVIAPTAREADAFARATHAEILE